MCENVCGSTMLSFLHHEVSYCLPTTMDGDICHCIMYRKNIILCWWVCPACIPCSSINRHFWSHTYNLSEYGGFLIVAYTHHTVSLCLPTAICNGIRLFNHYWHNLLHLFPARTLHSYIISYLWSHNEIISEYEGFWIVSCTNQMVSLCLPTAICDGIRLYNHYWCKPITFLSSSDTLLIY
jgi:hypothetical protein